MQSEEQCLSVVVVTQMERMVKVFKVWRVGLPGAGWDEMEATKRV